MPKLSGASHLRCLTPKLRYGVLVLFCLFFRLRPYTEWGISLEKCKISYLYPLKNRVVVIINAFVLLIYKQKGYLSYVNES